MYVGNDSSPLTDLGLGVTILASYGLGGLNHGFKRNSFNSLEVQEKEGVGWKPMNRSHN